MLHVTMQLPLPLLLGQLAILSISFKGIVCPVLLDFVIENFGTVDVYSRVETIGSSRWGLLVLKKRANNTASSVLQQVLRISDIIFDTIAQEENRPKIVSFSVAGAPEKNYNIKFRFKRQANMFISFKALPPLFKIVWARIYSNRRSVIMAHEQVYSHFGTGDIGFKMLENEDCSNLDERLNRQPYVFQRSEIQKEIITRLPQTLYMRNRIYEEDYEIRFKSPENLRTFLELFPERIYDEQKAANYYFMPLPRADSQRQDTWESD